MAVELNDLPIEVLALIFEWLSSVADLCRARATCRKWGGYQSDDGESLDGALRETLLSLNGGIHFGTTYSPLFDHLEEPRPPYGTARPLRLFLCLCGDQLEELSLGLGTNKGFKSLLLWLASYSPNLKVLKLCDRFTELPYSYGGSPVELPQNFFLLGGGGFSPEIREMEEFDRPPASAWFQLERLEFGSRIHRHRHTLHWLAQSAAAPALKHLSLTFDSEDELRHLAFIKALVKLETLTLLHSSATPFGKQLRGTTMQHGASWYSRPSGKKKHRISEEMAHPLRGLTSPNLKIFNWGFSSDALFPLHLPSNFVPAGDRKDAGGRKKEPIVRQVEPEWYRRKREDALPSGFQVEYRPADFLPQLSSLTLRHRLSGYILRLLEDNCSSNLTSLNLLNCVPSDPSSFLLFLGSCRQANKQESKVSVAKGSSCGGKGLQLKELRIGLWITELEDTKLPVEGSQTATVADSLAEAFPLLELLNIGSERPPVGQSWGFQGWSGSRETLYHDDSAVTSRRLNCLHRIINTVLQRCSNLTSLHVPEQTKFSQIEECLRAKSTSPLKTLGLHRLNLESDPMDYTAFKSFFSESENRLMSNLEELNLFNIRCGSDLDSVLQIIAARCDRLQKFYLSAPRYPLGFFRRLGGPKLEVLHLHFTATLGQGIVYNEFLDAIQHDWIGLTELCISSEDKVNGNIQAEKISTSRKVRKESSLYHDVRRRLKLCSRNATCHVSVGMIAGQEKATSDHDDYWDRYNSFDDDFGGTIDEDGGEEEAYSSHRPGDADDDWERSHSYEQYSYDEYYYDYVEFCDEADDRDYCF